MSFLNLPRLRFSGASLLLLLTFAYNVDRAYLENAPKGAEGLVFDIDAKSDGDVPLTYERVQPLMQALLRDRFGLVAHRSTKQVKGYALVLTKGGPMLKRSTAESGMAYIMRNEIRAPSADLGAFARMLASPVQRPVVDETGVIGNYDIRLRFAPLDAVPDTDPALPSLFTAVKEQLGLELKPKMVTVNTLVIERIQVTPTED